jgi:putative RecB family exonuclease
LATYSNTRLSMYETCPFKYKLVYIDRVERPPEESIEAFLGNKVHQVLQKCYNDARFTKLDMLDDLLRYYKNLWQKDWHDAIYINKPDFTRDHYFEHGNKMLSLYYERYFPFDADRTLGTEMQFYFMLDREKRYRMSGLIDRLARASDGTFVIHDYKTSATLPDQETADADRQLGLYHIAILRKWPAIKNIRLVWHYLSFDTELVSSRSTEAVNDLIGNTVKLIEEIESVKEFPPRESALCSYCEYQSYCPRRKHVVLVESLPVEEYIKEPGVVLVNEFAGLKRQQKDLSERLEAAREKLLSYSRQESVDVIQGNDCKVVIKSEAKVKFPRKNEPSRKQLETILKETGKWVEVSELDTGALGKMIARKQWNPDLLKSLAQFETMEDSTIVRFYDETGEEEE